MFYATPNADAGASIQSDQHSQLSSNSKYIYVHCNVEGVRMAVVFDLIQLNPCPVSIPKCFMLNFQFRSRATNYFYYIYVLYTGFSALLHSIIWAAHV